MKCLPFLIALVIPLHAASLQLPHPQFTVTVNDDGGMAGFSITGIGKPGFWAENGVLFPGHKVAGKLTGESIQDPLFGPGKRIRVPMENGAIAIDAHETLPFALVRSMLKNTSPAETDIRSITVLTFDYPALPDSCRTMGTGGLLPPDKNPGSYLFLACANPGTREGVVGGWITQNRGSGAVFSRGSNGKVTFEAKLDHGHLFLKPGQGCTLDTFALGRFDDARVGLEQYSDALAKSHHIKLKAKSATYCTWYAEGPGHGQAGNAQTTLELSKFIKDQRLKEYGLGVIQLDDRWQDGPNIQGPATEFGRVKPNGPYKDGIAPVARQVKADGTDFGLWWLPFGRNHMQPEYKDKQDWFVKKTDGTPLRQQSFGGTCLDSTNPAVREHLKSLARQMKDWGVDYFKMDGLSVGAGVDHVYINDGYKDDHFGECQPLHDRSKTNIEALRLGLETIREGAGPDVFFSGCCAVQNMRIYAGTIGLVDSMRVGPDFNHDGQGIRSGPLRGSWVYFLNGKVWWNDPDPTKVRTSNAKSEGDPSANGAVTTDQARMTSSWVSLTNQFFLISDWLPDLPAERLDILRRTMAAHLGTARPVDYFDNNLPNTWLVTAMDGTIRRDVAGVFNFYPIPLKVSHTFAKLGLETGKTYHAFDFWANSPLPDLTDKLGLELPANSCKVIALRAAQPHPQLLSTSRHVTQGMLEVSHEQWDADTLSGDSQVISGDPYELRIHVPEGYIFDAAATSTKEAVNGSTDGRLLRITFTPATSGKLTWKINFRKA